MCNALASYILHKCMSTFGTFPHCCARWLYFVRFRILLVVEFTFDVPMIILLSCCCLSSFYDVSFLFSWVSRTMHARVFVLPCCCCCLRPCCFGDLYGGFLGQFVWERREFVLSFFSLILIPTIVFIITSILRVVPCWLCWGCREWTRALFGYMMCTDVHV